MDPLKMYSHVFPIQHGDILCDMCEWLDVEKQLGVENLWKVLGTVPEIPSLKLTYSLSKVWKNGGSETACLLGRPIFRVYVSFDEYIIHVIHFSTSMCRQILSFSGCIGLHSVEDFPRQFNRKIYLTFSSRTLAFSDSDVLNKEWQELPCCSPWPCLGHVQKDSRFYWKHRVQNTSKHFVDTSEIYLIHIYLFHMQMFKEQGEDRSFSGKHRRIQECP